MVKDVLTTHTMTEASKMLTAVHIAFTNFHLVTLSSLHTLAKLNTYNMDII